MPKGRVKWFNENRGYGFIEWDDGEKDAFVHHSEIQGESNALHEGDAVEFEVVQDPRGPRAILVVRVT